MTPSLLAIAGLLLACGSDPDPADSGAAADSGASGQWDGNTGPYSDDAGEEPTASVDVEALGAAIEDAVELAITLHAGPALEAYGELASGMDAECPAWYVSEGNPYWYDSCVADSGTAFEGYALVVEYDDFADADGTVYDGYQYYGYCSIVAPGGRAFQSRGAAGLLVGQTVDGALISYSYLESGFYDSDADGTWLDSSIDPAYLAYTTWYPDYQGRTVLFDGVLSGLTGEIEALVFDELAVISENIGGCEQEPDGPVSVLDGEGQWIDVLFDAVDGADPACDGCGEAWVHGVSVGTVCADFSAAVDWEVSPWF